MRKRNQMTFRMWRTAMFLILTLFSTGAWAEETTYTSVFTGVTGSSTYTLTANTENSNSRNWSCYITSGSAAFDNGVALTAEESAAVSLTSAFTVTNNLKKVVLTGSYLNYFTPSVRLVGTSSEYVACETVQTETDVELTPSSTTNAEGKTVMISLTKRSNAGSETPVISQIEVVTTSAESYGLTVAGIEVTSANAADLLGDGKVSYNDDTKTLTLNGATMSGNIVRTSGDDLNVNLIGENTLTITNQNDYVFVGSGTLTITSDEATSGSLKTIHRCSKDSICSGWNSAPTFTYSRSDGEAAGYDCLWENYDYLDYMVIRENVKYALWIGGQQFCAAMLEPDSGIKFVPSTNTLEYSYYGTYNFTSSLPALTISVSNQTQMGSVTFSPTDQQPTGTLTIVKNAESEAAENSLTLSNDGGVITGFSSVVISEPLHLVNPSEVPATWDANTTETLISDATYYQLWVNGQQVSSGNAGNILYNINNDEPTLSFDAETNTLTMNGVDYSPNDDTPFVRSGLAALTVKLKDSNSIYVGQDVMPPAAFVSTNAEAVLTFTTDEATRLQPLNTNTVELASGFSSIVFTGYLYREQNMVKNLLAPSPSLYDGNLEINRAGYEPDGTTFNYVIDYVDEALEDATGTYDVSSSAAENNVTLAGPCIVTVFAQYGTTKSAEKEGRYFGFAQSELNVVYGTTEVDLPAIVPAMGDYVEVGYEGNVEEGKINVSDTPIGKNATMVQAFFSATLDVMPFTILNDFSNLTVNVIPPAPSIVFDETEDYLDTDKVSITMPEALAEDENASIKYSWVEDCPDGDGSNYTDESMVTLTAGTHTLYAWVRYNGETADDAVYSTRVSQVFTVKSDIGNAYIPEFTTTATYTGETITPAFTVYDSEKTQVAVGADNYTVSYQKIGTQVEDVEAIVEVGTYVITITGSGDTWGGSKTVTREFQVTQAENQLTTTPAAIAGLIYTGTELELVTAGAAAFGDVQYKVGENGTYSTEIPTATDAATYTVYYKVEGTDNYAAIEETSIEVTIGSNPLTSAFASGKTWATYYNTGDSDLPLPTGINAYVVTAVNGTTATVQAISNVPRSAAVLLEQNETAPADVAESTDGLTNLLRGAETATPISTFTGGTVYVLYGDEFVKSVSGTLPAGKACLVVSAASGAPRRLSIGRGDDTTAIETVTGFTSSSELGDTHVYDLGGRQVVSGKEETGKLPKGVYIRNGKKMVVK